jgi:hypothetical protein
MTNDEVIQLVTAGLSEEVIITSIRQASAKAFDLAPTGLIALKKAGVSDAVILAMQSDTAATAAVNGAKMPPEYRSYADYVAATAPVNAAKMPPKYDASLANPPKQTEPVAAPTPQNSCAGIELMGVGQIEGGPGVNIYVATIRNKAAYTMEVDIEYFKNDAVSKGTWNIKAGEKIEARLDVNNRPPTNVHITACR